MVAALFITLLFLMWDMLRIYHAYFWMLIALMHGLLFKPVMLFLELPSKEFYEQFLLKNIASDTYYLFGMFHLLFIGLVVMFYIFLRLGKIKLVTKSDRKIHVNFDIKKILLLISFVLVALIYEIIKRGPENVLHGKKFYTATTIDTYQSSTMLQIVVWMALPIAFMLMVNIKSLYKAQTSKFVLAFVLVLIFIISMIFDNRGQLVFSLVSIYAASVYLKIKIKPVTKTMISLLVVSILTYMTALRTSADNFISSLLSVINSLVGRNFVEISKSIHIIKALDHDLEYTYFTELINPILLYIPRAVYPDKPVNVDTTVGIEVFGCKYFGACAVPPGAFAQSIWSAGLASLILLSFALAVVILYVDQLLKERSYRDGSFVVFYFSLILFVFIDVLGSGYTSFLRQFIIKSFILFFILRFVRQRTRYYEC